jgi:RNA polymerase sigma-70 factor, ECF subfamily
MECALRAVVSNFMQLRLRATDPVPQPAAIPFPQAQFASLYEDYVTRVYGFVFSHVGNREDAEDVTSQVFIKAYRNLGQFAGRGRLENWLFQIARMAVADFWRDRYKLKVVPLVDGWDIASSDGAREFDGPAREERVKRLLERLPDNYRRVLELRFFQRCSTAETARGMGVSEDNARVLQFRALRRAAELAREGGW